MAVKPGSTTSCSSAVSTIALVHEGGFSCEKAPSDEVVFSDRRKQPLLHWSVLPRRNTEGETVKYLHERFDHLGIDADTCIPQWYAGDTCDWGMAVDGLLQSDFGTLQQARISR